MKPEDKFLTNDKILWNYRSAVFLPGGHNAILEKALKLAVYTPKRLKWFDRLSFDA